MSYTYNPFTDNLDLKGDRGGGTITDVQTANATPQFVEVGSTSTVDFGISNLVLGSDLPNLTTGLQNVGLGQFVFEDLTIGTGNVSIGFFSGKELTEGVNNVFVGEAAGQKITTGSSNTFIGDGAGAQLINGSGNTGIGNSALDNITTASHNICIANGIYNASSITSGESSNILIASDGGTDNNTIRLGTQGSSAGQQNRAFVAGITGVTVAASAPVGVDTNGQLSSLGFGTSGDVLTSNGPGASPTYQTPLDYEEGSFTPTLSSSGTQPTPTYSIQFGSYQRVGNRVTVNIVITLTAWTPGTGFLRISNLPFTSANVANNRSAAALLGANITFSQDYITAWMQPNTNFFAIWGTVSGGSGTSLSVSAFTSNTSVTITGSYLI